MSREDKKRLILICEQYLQKLLEQKASFGLYAPAHILMDIDNTQAEIERLTNELGMELQETILRGTNKAGQEAFVEFNQQIENYLNRFHLLHIELEVWKQIHNALQDLQINFASCRSYIFQLDKSSQEKIFFRIEVVWRPCRRDLDNKLELWTSQIEEIQTDIMKTHSTHSIPGSSKSQNLWKIAIDIETALNESNLVTLLEHLSVFGDLVDKLLYRADKKILYIVGEINHLSRPSFYLKKS